MARAERVAARTAVEAKMIISFYLRRSRGQEIDVHSRGGSVRLPNIRTRSHTGSRVSWKASVRMRRRDIRRGDLRDRCGPGHRLGRRRHHGPISVDHSVVLAGGSSGGSGCCCEMLGLVVPSGIRVVVNSRMAGEFIGATEAFSAARELAGMRLLARMRANVSGLMLQTVESAVAERAFVRPREVLSYFAVCGTAAFHHRR